MSAHPNLYSRTENASMWIQQGDKWLYQTTTNTFEFDTVMHEWVKTKSETKTQEPSELGYLKEIKFVVTFPDDSEPSKIFGKGSKKMPKLLMQIGNCRVRPELKDVWLITETQKPIERQGALAIKKIFVKALDLNGLCYRFAYMSDDRVTVALEQEQETTLAMLKKLEGEGYYVIFHGKALYNEQEGFTYGDVAMNASG